MSDGPAPDGVRVDVWLDVACLVKTRSQAQAACRGGKVEVNGSRAKAHRLLHTGDEVRITLPGGRRRIVVVTGLADRHLPKAEARELYDDRTPPPSPEEVELRRLQRLVGPPPGGRRREAPSKRERRRIRRAKEGDEI